MSDRENVLARWSRRKLDERAARDAAPTGTEGEAAGPAVEAETEAPFDLASLPSIDTITADTDLRVFIGKGIPTDLTRAALRRGWSADPAIRDFIGLSENSWDFNDPNGIPGFGALNAEDVRKILADMMKGPTADDVGETVPVDVPLDETASSSAVAAQPSSVRMSGADNLAIHESAVDTNADLATTPAIEAARGEAPVNREAGRRHGSALPRMGPIDNG